MKQNYLTYYELLGVEATATTEQILTAYREKTKKYHPDKNNGSEVSSEMFRYLTEAKEWLTNPEKRKQYDQLIGITSKPQTEPKVVYKDRIVMSQPTGSKELAGVAVAAGLFGLLVGVLLNDE